MKNYRARVATDVSTIQHEARRCVIKSIINAE
jgi:hypothetical protein